VHYDLSSSLTVAKKYYETQILVMNSCKENVRKANFNVVLSYLDFN